MEKSTTPLSDTTRTKTGHGVNNGNVGPIHYTIMIAHIMLEDVIDLLKWYGHVLR